MVQIRKTQMGTDGESDRFEKTNIDRSVERLCVVVSILQITTFGASGAGRMGDEGESM